MSLVIMSELSKTYLQEEDAIKGFKTAVENNQLRLAMQILSEIVDVFAEGFDIIFNANEDGQNETKEVQEEPKKVEEQVEKKTSNKKSEPKEEKPKDTEQ
jgi:predicted phage-related endonuclease